MGNEGLDPHLFESDAEMRRHFGLPPLEKPGADDGETSLNSGQDGNTELRTVESLPPGHLASTHDLDVNDPRLIVTD